MKPKFLKGNWIRIALLWAIFGSVYFPENMKACISWCDYSNFEVYGPYFIIINMH